MELQEIESQERKSEEFEEKEESREQTSETKTSYQDRIRAELKSWVAKFDQLKADVEKSGAEMRKMFEKQIEILGDKQKAAVRKLSTLKRSREEGWKRFRDGLEKGLDDLKQTLDQTFSTLKEKQQQVAEKVSKQRAAYIDKIEAQFSVWSKRVDALKKRMEKAKSEAIIKYDRQIEDLRRRQLLGKKKLQEFKRSGGESWEDLKKGMDKALSDMKKSFEKAFSRMKRK
jgi:hypothetical protein